MEKAKENIVFSGLALLSGLFYLGIPVILLMSDFEQGGIAQVLEAIKAPEYDEIELWAFYVPIAALVLFTIFAISILSKSKVSVAIGVVCAVFSIWSLFEINTIGLFGLLVSGWYLFNAYIEAK